MISSAIWDKSPRVNFFKAMTVKIRETGPTADMSHSACQVDGVRKNEKNHVITC